MSPLIEALLAESGQAEAAGRSPDGSGSDSLPCLNRNNSTELTLTGAQKRTAFALAFNVRQMVEQYGVDRVGFLTLTFKDHVTDVREAQRRFNSLRTHVICKRYVDTITVMERQASGRIHYHLLVVLAQDIRTGFDFEAVAKEDYRSANRFLREEWCFWRKICPKYRFGRTELMPLKSTGEGIAKYVGKYISKHMEQRRQDDKGARLVRYSEGARRCGTRFAWAGPKSKEWRRKLEQFAVRHGCLSFELLRERFGKNWAYRLAEYIAEEVLPPEPGLPVLGVDDLMNSGVELTYA